MQFMAIDILESIHFSTPIKQTAEHDIESFLWVIAYATMFKIVNTIPTKEDWVKNVRSKRLEEYFHLAFGAASCAGILAARDGLAPFAFVAKVAMHQFLLEFISKPFLDLLTTLPKRMLQRKEVHTRTAKYAIGPREGAVQDKYEPLTHDWLIGCLDRTIGHVVKLPSASK